MQQPTFTLFQFIYLTISLFLINSYIKNTTVGNKYGGSSCPPNINIYIYIHISPSIYDYIFKNLTDNFNFSRLKRS